MGAARHLHRILFRWAWGLGPLFGSVLLCLMVAACCRRCICVRYWLQPSLTPVPVPLSALPAPRSLLPAAPPLPADMHWMLRVISLGHVRTFTHHRLLLLEQKFNLHVMLNAGEARCCLAFVISYAL